MAELADGRVYKRKRIKDPTNQNNYIDIPVIYEAKFKCMHEQAQEQWLYFNNSSTSSRKTHIKRITNNQHPSQYLDAERIDELTIKIMQEQAQERTFILRNNDPPPMQPNGSNNPAHEKTHIVRYYQNNIGGNGRRWIDVELIDNLKIIDASSQYQEWLWYLKHPGLGNPVNDSSIAYSATIGFCDPSLEAAPVETNFDPPYRLDIFQNIINCNWISEEEVGTAGFWTLWISNDLIDWQPGTGAHSTWFYRWIQYNPWDPPYELTANERDFGLVGNVPWRDVDIGGFQLIKEPSWSHYIDTLDEISLEAALETPFGAPGFYRAVVEFRLGPDWDETWTGGDWITA